MATKKKLGRPSLTPEYIKIINETPKGESVQVGMHPTNEPFVSHQAAAYHRDNIRTKLGVKSAVEVITVDEAVEDSEHIEDRYWQTFARGYYLMLHGRKKVAA